MQNEKIDTFESLYPAVHGSKLLKIHDNLTQSKQSLDKPLINHGFKIVKISLLYYSKFPFHVSAVANATKAGSH